MLTQWDSGTVLVQYWYSGTVEQMESAGSVGQPLLVEQESAATVGQ